MNAHERTRMIDTAAAAAHLGVSKRYVETRRNADPEFRAIWHDLAPEGAALRMYRVELEQLISWARSRCFLGPADQSAASAAA